MLPLPQCIFCYRKENIFQGWKSNFNPHAYADDLLGTPGVLCCTGFSGKAQDWHTKYTATTYVGQWRHTLRGSHACTRTTLDLSQSVINPLVYFLSLSNRLVDNKIRRRGFKSRFRETDIVHKKAVPRGIWVAWDCMKTPQPQRSRKVQKKGGKIASSTNTTVLSREPGCLLVSAYMSVINRPKSIRFLSSWVQWLIMIK